MVYSPWDRKRVRQDLETEQQLVIIYSSCTCLYVRHCFPGAQGPVSPAQPMTDRDGSDLQNEPFTYRGDPRPNTCFCQLMSMPDISM